MWSRFGDSAAMRLASQASSLLVLSVIGLTATLSEANEIHGVFGRLKHVTGGKEGEAAAEPEVKHHRRGLQTIAGAFEKAGTPAHTAYLQSVRKNGVDPLALFEATAKSEAMKKLLNNPEIQHRLLEEIPLLGAIPGFKAVTGRRLSNEATMVGFAEGLKSLLSLTKNMDKTVKDPLYMLNIVDEMQKSDDPEMKELFRLSSLNDVGAMQKLQNIAVDKAFPGVDMAHIRKVRDESNFDKLLKYPELKAFIDQDEEISKILRATTAPLSSYPKKDL